MSRVQNLLPTVPAARSKPGPTTGRDFDDVLARTYQDRPRDTTPAPGTQRPPAADRQPGADGQTRADQRAHSDDTRPEPARTAPRRPLRDAAAGAATRAGRRDDEPSDDEAADAVGVATGEVRANAARSPVADDAGTGTGHDADQTATPGSGTDILAEPVAGVIVDPMLLAAMITTAPTVLAPATAPEPEAGMISVAAVDGGTAIIVTAPATAAGTDPDGAVPAGTGTGGTGTDQFRGISGSGAAPATSGAAAAPTSTTPATNATPVTGAVPGPPATAAVPAVPAAPVPAAGVTGEQGPLLAAALPPATDTAAPSPVSATGASAALGTGAVAPGAAVVPGTNPATTALATSADAVLPAAPGAAPAAVDPVAAALAGAYGSERPAPSGDRATGPVGSTPAPGGTLGALGPIGAGSASGAEPNGSSGPDTGRNPEQGGTGAQFARAAGDAATVPAPGTSGPSASTAAAGLPATPGIPVTGVNGVTGVAGVTGTAGVTANTGSAEPSSRTSEITDQVAAQIGRQLQSTRLLRDGTHHTVLRLSPEHLGEVVITLDVRAGGIRLDLAAGSQALVALQADLGRLRDDLAGAGLDLADVTLSSQDPGPGTNGQSTARERWQDPAPTGRERPGDRANGSATPADQSAGRASGRARDGGLDVLA